MKTTRERAIRLSFLLAIAVGLPRHSVADAVPSIGGVRFFHTPAWYAQRRTAVRALDQGNSDFLQSGPSPTQNMTYHGGAVMQTHTAHTIFWAPAPSHSVPASYSGLVNRWFRDIGGSPFLNIVTQYYQDDSPSYPFAYIQNVATLGGTWVDTSNPYPHPGTAAAPLLDVDIQAEVLRAIAANGWPNGGRNVEFFVYTALGIESCYDGTRMQCTIGSQPAGGQGGYCAYHGAFGSCANPIIYANMPYAATWKSGFTYNCGVHDAYPNDPDADLEISPTSHEQFESITDPFGCGSVSGWYDTDGTGEIGDKCAYIFGSVGADGGNLSLNGNRYVVQQEWSNTAFDGTPYSGCVLPAPPSLTCAATPAVGCRKPTKKKAAVVSLKTSAHPSKNALSWKWNKGEATTTADLGDPATSTDYAFCVYDEDGGVPSLVMGVTAPAGASWFAGSFLVDYYNPLPDNGLVEIKVDTGGAGKAKIVVKGKGGNLALPALPLKQNQRVVVQLQNSIGACWEADYSARATTNNGKKFNDKSD